ncbi:hypothetical protein ANN_18451 [Periplaneta americana]|uniref:HMG box domain-containing protein n=1 Tax=Periplaneta americana TaxID=6978 RepID=A0ABQ8SQ97_PERAM|nr:hypothetical protein ANN_18451 [Periplaneta americana]
MEDEAGGLLFSTCINNVSQQFSISTVSLPPVSSDDERSENRIDTVTAANDLLENGILVETNKGLVCLSLKDALSSGVGGLNLSVEDFQNVAAQLLTQQNVEKATAEGSSPPLTLGDLMLNVLPDTTQVYGNNGNLEIVDTSVPLQVQIDLSENTKNEEKGLKKINGDTITEVSSKRKQTEPAVTGALIQDSPPGTIQTSVVTSSQQQKKRGGWPKGRKRKPELSEMRPPKAPATGYVLYLNEKRKQYKDLPFPEVTKLLGNEWSKLSLEEKRIYLERAEVEKKRYREELKAYRQSDAYQSYLNKKRTKNLQGNGTEESDMDATDEIEDEDNEELYCRTCDQWFSSLHNKKEHLYGRQHLQSIAGDFTKERLAAEQDGNPVGTSSHSMSTSLDESSLDGAPVGRSGGKGASRYKQQDGGCGVGPSNMTDAITRFLEVTTEREREIKLLSLRLKEVQTNNTNLMKELSQLKEREKRLLEDMECEKEAEGVMEQQLYNLWTVPTMFFINSEVEQQDSSETIPVFICLPDES